jgi:pSer/pThr/pTyr-binding forkhead associated (FHA) protein
VPLVEGDQLVVGRSGGADVVIDVPTISRRHARFVVRGGQVYVEDLESHNGVSVNGQRIRDRTAVVEGDRIQVGDQEVWITGADRAVLSTQPPPGHGASTLPPPEASRRATAPMVITPRMHLDHATAALDSGRHGEALRAFADFAFTIESEIARGKVDQPAVIQATIALIQLTDATGDAKPLEILLRVRRLADLPLDPHTTEEITRSILELPQVADAERRAYCRWFKGKPASFTERRAVQRLEEA